MKSIISLANICRILLIGAVFGIVFGVFAPQVAEAHRVELQRAMPVTDGDPGSGLDNCGGGGGGGAIIPPPEEAGWNSSPKNQILSLDAMQMVVENNVNGMLILTPYFNGTSIIWTIYISNDPVQGGLN